jgi:hypothetical protein
MRRSKAATAASPYGEGDRQRVDRLGRLIDAEATSDYLPKQEADRLNRIAAAFVVATVAEKKRVSAGREFLRTTDRMDQRVVVDVIVQRMCALAPHADPEEMRARVWADLHYHFNWQDVAALAPAGFA